MEEKIAFHYKISFIKEKIAFYYKISFIKEIIHIANALRSQLNWTQYRLLIQIDDKNKREYYELESVND